MNVYLDCSLRTPSHATVLLWVKKYGLYQLSRDRQKADDWVVVLDESVQFGQNKPLLVYGVRQSEIDFSRPLTFGDLAPLALAPRSSWTGEGIAGQLKPLEATTGKIKYAVADQGNPIKKALKTMGVYHVHDVTHRISLIVEHIYKNDPGFKGYTKRLARLGGTQALGKMSHVLPPVQRSNARFMNLRPVSDWGGAVLNLLEKGPETLKREKQNLGWVGGHKGLILEFALLNRMVNECQLVLKTNGLSWETVKKCLGILREANTPRLLRFRDGLSKYLKETMGDRPMKELGRLLCSSDIIESAFGKYKNYIHSNPMVGITNLSLSLAAFTGKLSREEMKDALRTTRVENVRNWTTASIGQTTLSKRSAVLKWDEKKNQN